MVSETASPWLGPKKMPSAKAQINDTRQVAVTAAARDYRGSLLAGRDLIEVSGINILHLTLVLSNQHRFLKVTDFV